MLRVEWRARVRLKVLYCSVSKHTKTDISSFTFGRRNLPQRFAAILMLARETFVAIMTWNCEGIQYQRTEHAKPSLEDLFSLESSPRGSVMEIRGLLVRAK